VTEDVRLIQGDCLEVMRGMEDASVDVILTDPPYLNGEDGVHYRYPGVASRANETSPVGNPWGYSLEWVDACARFHPKHWIVFCNSPMLGELHVAISRHAKVKAIFVWRKSNYPQSVRPVPRMDCEYILWAMHPKASCGRMREFKSLVLDVPMLQAGCFAQERLTAPGSGKALHPCQKPLAIVQPFVTRIMEPVATILDPFAGTGTTGVACQKAGQKAILIESDPRYIPCIERRVSDAGTPLFYGIETNLCPATLAE
jgi:DNA modification methylase